MTVKRYLKRKIGVASRQNVWGSAHPSKLPKPLCSPPTDQRSEGAQTVGASVGGWGPPTRAAKAAKSPEKSRGVVGFGAVRGAGSPKENEIRPLWRTDEIGFADEITV